ncbi:MAG: DHH family phosphoesterase [Haloarculaceae archaeon]
MDTRLVLGCGSIGHAIVESIADRPGRLLVLDDSARRVERLREEGISARRADVTATESLRAEADDVISVVVADDAPDANVAAARAAAASFPDAVLIAYAGAGPDADQLAALADVADEVIDPGGATAADLLDRVGDDSLQVRQLRRAFWAIDEPLAIVTHDNPDPDAIASAIALQRIAAAFGVDAEVCYYGQITHQENRAFINLLDFQLTRLDSDTDLSEYGGFALVDHSRPGVNDQLPEETPIDVVVDHHPPRAPVDARFVDLRSNVGATSTLLVQYLQRLGIEIEEDVATGLLFGIRVDTKDFSREVATDDFEAAAAIVPAADVATLERIESPSVSGDTFETIAAAIANRRQRGSVLTSFVGALGERDALAQAADRLLDLEGVNATVVYGILEGVIYVSGRARGTDLDLGETLREAFDQIGSAGGHADMAGAQIEVENTTLDVDGEFPTEADADDGRPADAGAAPTAGAGDSTAEDGEAADGEAAPDGHSTTERAGEAAAVEIDRAVGSVDEELEEFVAERFFEALSSRPRRELTGLYAPRQFDSELEW